MSEYIESPQVPAILIVEAGVRYPEDATIDGEPDSDTAPKMPFMVLDKKYPQAWRWSIKIDICSGKILDWPEDVPDAQVFYKVCDECRIKYGDKVYEDYVPDFLAIDDEGYGDYIYLTIKNGKISGWKKNECVAFLRGTMKAI